MEAEEAIYAMNSYSYKGKKLIVEMAKNENGRKRERKQSRHESRVDKPR